MQQDEIVLSHELPLNVQEAQKALHILQNKLQVKQSDLDNFVLAPAALNTLELLLLQYESDKVNLLLRAQSGEISNQQEFVSQATAANIYAEVIRYLVTIAKEAAVAKAATSTQQVDNV